MERVLEREEQSVIAKFCVTTFKVGTPLSPHYLTILTYHAIGITKPAIRRLARRGGVKRISASMFTPVLHFYSVQF